MGRSDSIHLADQSVELPGQEADTTTQQDVEVLEWYPQEMRAQQPRHCRECWVRSATPIDAFEVSVKIKGIGHRHPQIIATAIRHSLGHCI